MITATIAITIYIVFFGTGTASTLFVSRSDLDEINAWSPGN